MSTKIYINYRRGDDPRFTSALYTRLEEEFGRDSIVMDAESYIGAGGSFARELNALLEQSAVMLAVIGPRWEDRLAARANDPEDFVAIEIRAALSMGKPVIPILVGGASLPRADELPEAIRGLVRRGGAHLRPAEFQADCDGLIRALKQAFATAGAARERPRAEAGWQPVEGNRGRQDPGDAARASPAGQGKWEQAQAGRVAEESRKSGELANWESIKDSRNPDEFRYHLARFAGGPTERAARQRLEALQSGAYRQETAAGGDHRAAERRRGETEAWSSVATRGSVRELEEFLEEFPNGAYAGPARRRLAELEQQAASGGGAMSMMIMLGIVVLMVGLIVLATVKF